MVKSKTHNLQRQKIIFKFTKIKGHEISGIDSISIFKHDS